MRRWLWQFALLGALACGCLQAAVPERPRFRLVGPAQGLPSTEIKALAHDAAGYLWIATADGLARYDGVGMRVWRHDPDQPGSLPGNNVQALVVDARDRVWAATEGGGVSVLDATRQQFVHFRKDRHPELGSDDVWAMARQGDAIWLGTYDGGLTRIDADGSMRRFTAAVHGLPSDIVLSLAVDAGNRLWVGTPKGLAREHAGGFEAVTLPGADEAPTVFSLSREADGLWVGTSHGVWVQGRDGWQQPDWSPMFHRPNAVMALVTDGRGDHWIASQRGLWRQRAGQPPVPVQTGGPEVPRTIMALQREGASALWVPLAGRGLGYLRSDWRHLAQLQGAADGLRGVLYRAVGPARDGGTWLGAINGVVELLRPDGEVRALDDDTQERLRGIKPSAIAEDAAGRVWLGHGNGVIRIGVDGAVDEWRGDDPSAPAPAGMITHLALAPDGSLWLASPGGGVQQRDPVRGRILRDLPAGEASGLGDLDLDVLAIAPGGQPWLATSQGVLAFHPATGKFSAIPAMAGIAVHALAFDGPDVVWLQRLSGLEQYRRQGSGWRQVDRVEPRHGVPAVAAAGMVVDARHRVWLSTSRGLYRWEPLRRNVRHLGVQDGSGSQEFLDRATFLRADGVLVAATADGGLTLVDTNAPDPGGAAAALRFDGVAVRRGGEWQPLPAGPRLRLTQDDRELQVAARLLAFDEPAAHRYWSRLEGFDRDWVALGSSGERVLAGLAPGRYTLRMRAQDGAGNAAQEQALQFEVPPPWWRTPWASIAFALLGVLGVVALAFGYRQRLARRHAWQLAEHKRELAEQASEAKSRFLATLGHEVRTPMTGVLGMSELLQGSQLDVRQRGQVDAIHRAGQHLLRLVNDALDLARIEAGKLELATTDFDVRRLLDEVVALTAPAAARKQLAFAQDVAADVPQVLHGDATRVRQILLNLVGNAIKFTEAGQVTLQVQAAHPGVRFIVSDTGPGLNADQQARLFRRFEQAEGARTTARYGGSGLGLAISQELAAAMGGSIGLESEPGSGTRFTVELPLRAGGPAPVAAVDQVGAGDAAADRAVVALRLLLVEDDDTVAQAIGGLLQAQGHHVVHASHGLAALAEVAARDFDAALLDLDLPGMDGLALARLLRARGMRMPLLAITARSDADAETQARAAGFDGFLRKPVTGATLADGLRQAGA